jgi:citrate synthase
MTSDEPITPLSNERLSSREVADRLGVKLETVYAYVSRGVLSRARVPSGRGSTFDRCEVDALLDRERRHRASGASTWRGPVVDTDLTLIENGRLYFRGVDAAELAAAHRFESAAQWLWTGDPVAEPFAGDPEQLEVARAAAGALPPSVDLVSRLRVAIAAAAAMNPLRYELRGSAVLASARNLLATMVDVLPRADNKVDTTGTTRPLTSRLWDRLTLESPSESLMTCLDTALVLLLDHDLAMSTVAVRIAASVRANPYAVVAAGLSAMDSPLHGGASSLAFTALKDAMDRAPRQVVADHLRASRELPGFGHRLYPDGDPRAMVLLEQLGTEPKASSIVVAARGLAQASGSLPNVDLALAALSLAAGMPREAGEVMFAIARTVGWIAHALEEYDETPLRFRGQGRYRGPRPPQSISKSAHTDPT